MAMSWVGDWVYQDQSLDELSKKNLLKKHPILNETNKYASE